MNEHEFVLDNGEKVIMQIREINLIGEGLAISFSLVLEDEILDVTKSYLIKWDRIYKALSNVGLL